QGGGTPMQRAEAAPARNVAAPSREAGPRPYYEVASTPPPAPAQAPAPEPVPSHAAPAAADGVQAGAYSERRGADRVARRLGDRASIQNLDRDGRTLFRVVVGPWPDATAAERARQAVIARGFSDALLIGG